MKHTGTIFGDLQQVAQSHGLKPVDGENLDQLKDRLFSHQITTPRGVKVFAGAKLRGRRADEVGEVVAPSADGRWVINRNFDLSRDKGTNHRKFQRGRHKSSEIDRYFSGAQ